MEKIKKSDHFYLIDGSGYIFRAYYALPPLTRKSDGLPVGAVSGFCNMLFKQLENIQMEKGGNVSVAVVFDAARKTFRNEIYPEYKANRSDPPDDLIPQFDIIKRVPEIFNLKSIESVGYEADDLIASYAECAEKLGTRVTVISSDKDLMQLLKKNITMLDPLKNKEIDREEVFKKFGVLGWVPTVEISINIIKKPAPGWIVGRFRTDTLSNGRMIESGSLWDSTGQQVAQSRQLGLIMSKDD